MLPFASSKCELLVALPFTLPAYVPTSLPLCRLLGVVSGHLSLHVQCLHSQLNILPPGPGHDLTWFSCVQLSAAPQLNWSSSCSFSAS